MGQFPPSHHRAVSPSKIVKVLQIVVSIQWRRGYLRHRLQHLNTYAFTPNLSIKYPFRFLPFLSTMADNLRRALQNIDLGIEDAPFSLPATIVQQAATTNQFCLIGRPLMPRKQNLRQILSTLPRSWGLVGFVRGRIVEQRRFQFIFPSEESLEIVLRRGPWAFADRMLVFQR